LQVSEYSPKELKDVLDTFISKYENATEKNRFHLVLNNVERNYLDWAQYYSGKSRTKVIRSALRSIIDSDEEFAKYLSEH
jgi:hypothetical protein